MKRARRPSAQTVAVLLALAGKAETWCHGYELCRSLGLPAGTVYPILMRLAERGYLDTAWEQDPPRGRPPRHLYRLSAAGERYLDAVRTADARGGASVGGAPVVPGAGA